jgi:GntR family transcriptional regulator, rspAB operon transcriptional repressor
MITPPPLRRERLAERVYATLRAEIVNGALPPDRQISEQEISERLQVSRTPLREALVRLVEDGLAIVYPQFGTFVAPIRLEAVAEAQFIREHLECALIREAAARITPEALRHLTDNIDRQERAARDQDHPQFYVLDEELHAGFAAASGRPGVWRLIQQSKVHLDRVRLLSLPIGDQLCRLIEQHKAIVAALADRAPDRAEQALRLHLREVFETARHLGLTEPAEERLPKRRRRPSAITTT